MSVEPNRETVTGLRIPRQPESAAADATRASGVPVSVGLVVATAVVIPPLLAYSLATRSELQVVAGVLAFVCLLIVVARPFWGLVFFVALLYTRVEEVVPALSGMRLTLMVSLVTLAATGIQLALKRERLTRTPVVWLMFGFAAMVVVSSLPNGNTATAAEDIGKLAVLVLLVLNLARTPQRHSALVTALIIFTGYLAAYSIYLYSTGVALYHLEDAARAQATGVFGNPNDLAAAIIPGLAFALHRGLRLSGWRRLGYVGLSCVLVWAVLLTHSRGGLLAMLVVSCVSIYLGTRNKRAALVLALAAAIALFGIASGRSTDFDAEEESANSRFHFWDNAIERLIEHPLTGVGYQAFADLNGGMAAHNSFVTCFVETGLPGYFCWIGCLYYAFRRRPGDTQSTSPSRAEAGDVLGARIALAGYLVESFWSNHTYIAILYLLVSLAVCGSTLSERPPGAARPAAIARWPEFLYIAGICAASIMVVQLLVWKMK